MKRETILLAEVDRPRGIRGEVVATLHADDPARLDEVRNLLIVDPGGRSRSCSLEGWKRRGERVVLKLSGIDSVEEARQIVGCEIHIRREDALRTPPEGRYFAHQLEGLRVVNQAGDRLGSVKRVISPAGQALLEIEGGPSEFVIPLVRAICVKIDLDRGEILVDLPEGLMDLNAV